MVIASWEWTGYYGTLVFLGPTSNQYVHCSCELVMTIVWQTSGSQHIGYA